MVCAADDYIVECLNAETKGSRSLPDLLEISALHANQTNDCSKCSPVSLESNLDGILCAETTEFVT